VARPVRFAVVGPGDIAQRAVLPAFEHARKKATLTALVSGEPTKRRALGRRLNGVIPNAREARRASPREGRPARLSRRAQRSSPRSPGENVFRSNGELSTAHAQAYRVELHTGSSDASHSTLALTQDGPHVNDPRPLSPQQDLDAHDDNHPLAQGNAEIRQGRNEDRRQRNATPQARHAAQRP
jgi:hypothetical protein